MIPSLYADYKGSGTVIPPIDVKKGGKNKGQRDVPSPIPQCYVADGIVHVVSPDDWSYATVTVMELTGSAQSINAGFLDEGIDVYLPAESGTFTITIVTESGDEFTGDFSL